MAGRWFGRIIKDIIDRSQTTYDEQSDTRTGNRHQGNASGQDCY